MVTILMVTILMVAILMAMTGIAPISAILDLNDPGRADSESWSAWLPDDGRKARQSTLLLH